jgi:hypothetical protein
MRTKESDGVRIVSPKELKRKVLMNISMHAMSHGVFKKALTQLLHVMEKGRRECHSARIRYGRVGQCAARAGHAAFQQTDSAHE